MRRSGGEGVDDYEKCNQEVEDRDPYDANEYMFMTYYGDHVCHYPDDLLKEEENLYSQLETASSGDFAKF